VTQFNEDFNENSGSVFTNGYDSNIIFLQEACFNNSLKVGCKEVGIRGFKCDLLDEVFLPISFAYKMAKK
jgi:hypothetical protein